MARRLARSPLATCVTPREHELAVASCADALLEHRERWFDQLAAVPRAAYDEIAARGHAAILAARPSLVNGPHVSMLGMLFETA